MWDHALVGEYGGGDGFVLLIIGSTMRPIDVVRRVLLHEIHTASSLRQVAGSCEAGRRQWPVVTPTLHSSS